MSAPDRRAARIALALLLVAGVAIAAAQRRRPASATELPEGEGRAIAERACRICHSAMLITQQAKDRAAWERSIRQMAAWGAPVDSAERDTLARWLAAAYGPRAR